MSCAFDTQTYVEYLNGEIAPAARSEFESHLPSCVRCRAEVEAYSRLLQGLSALPQREPPADLVETIVRAAVPRRPIHRRSASVWQRVMAVGAATALVVSFIVSTQDLLARAALSAWNNVSPGLAGAVEVGREALALLAGLNRVLDAAWNLITTVGGVLHPAVLMKEALPSGSLLLFLAFMLLTTALLWRLVGHPLARPEKEVKHAH